MSSEAPERIWRRNSNGEIWDAVGPIWSDPSTEYICVDIAEARLAASFIRNRERHQAVIARIKERIERELTPLWVYGAGVAAQIIEEETNR